MHLHSDLELFPLNKLSSILARGDQFLDQLGDVIHVLPNYKTTLDNYSKI